MLQEACALAQLHCEIHMVPWARVQDGAEHAPNLVYTTARKPSREKVFLWVGPIAQNDLGYGNIPFEQQPHSLQDLAQWRIGVVRDEAAYRDLLAAGIPMRALIVANSTHCCACSAAIWSMPWLILKLACNGICAIVGLVPPR